MTKEFLKELEAEYGKERVQLIKDVTTVVAAKVRAKNLFGWRYYIDEVLDDLIVWMIQTEFKYSGGAYVACGMQSAIDHCRYCNAAKRKANYEAYSIDRDERLYQIEDKREENRKKAWELYVDIKIQFGQDLADEVKPFIDGVQKELSKEVLAKLRTPEFMDWFKARTRG